MIGERRRTCAAIAKSLKEGEGGKGKPRLPLPVPIRSCIVCNGKHTKRQMLRLVCKNEADIVPDVTQTAAGRGRYICSLECANALQNIKLLRRAFRMNVTLAKADALLEALADCGWN